MIVDERLRRLLDDPELPALRLRLRKRYERALEGGGLADTLRAAPEMLDGAIPDRSAQRLIELQDWENLRTAILEPRLALLLADGKGFGLRSSAWPAAMSIWRRACALSCSACWPACLRLR